MTEKQKELLDLINAVDTGRKAFTGIHKRVAERNIYSGIMLSKFKTGEVVPVNYEKITELIEVYKDEIQKAKAQL
jgi:hypothetical protein